MISRCRAMPPISLSPAGPGAGLRRVCSLLSKYVTDGPKFYQFFALCELGDYKCRPASTETMDPVVCVR